MQNPACARIQVITAVILAVALTVAAPQHAFGQTTANQHTPVALTEPPAIFTNTCAQCHGPSGAGARGPSIVHRGLKNGSDAASLTASISSGFPTAGMPPFGDILSDDEINEIVTFITTEAAAVNPIGLALLAGGRNSIPEGVVNSALESFRVERVAEFSHPYGMTFLDDGRLLVIETNAAIRVVENGELLPEPISDAPLGIPPRDIFGRNLLDIAAHPTNGWIYLSSAVSGNPEDFFKATLLQLHRGRIVDGRWTEGEILLTSAATDSTGARIAFDEAGYVYFTALPADDQPGAREDVLTDTAQDIESPYGKIYRLAPDGSAPADNPFADNPNGNARYVWSYGHRSPQGITFDDQDRLWIVENGPQGGDELNLILKGANYGWPMVTLGHRYDRYPIPAITQARSVEQPIVNWNPSPAIAGVAFYTGDAFPRWKGSLFIGSMVGQTLYRVVVDDENRAVLQEKLLMNLDRIRNVEAGPDGYIYIVTDSGSLLRLVPEN